MTDLMTPAPELRAAPDFEPTGNLQVHLSANRSADGAVGRVGVVHLGVDAVLDLVGADGGPLLEPRILVAGVDFTPEAVTHLADWVPRWHYRGPGWVARLTLLAPIGERGFALRLDVDADAPTSLELRLTVSPGGLEAVRFSSQPLAVPLRRHFDPWTRSLVWDCESALPLLAMAAHLEGAWRVEDEGDLGAVAHCVIEPCGGEVKSATAYFGVAPEGDGARTTALHLRRVGWDELLGRTEAWLRRRRVRSPVGLEGFANRNLFFSYFFAQADSLDSDEPIMLTSRSFVYYVSGAFWSRDSLLWALPACLEVDAERAKVQLRTAFARYARHPGEHAQYLRGAVLYPGFELDEAAAYPFALARYLERTGDRDLAAEPAVREGLRWVLDAIRARAHPTRTLYRTFLSPTDDPVPETPYLAYDNFLLASALTRLGAALSERDLVDWGNAVLAEARACFRTPGPYGHMYAFGMAEDGATVPGDEPAGSLLLLPYLGACTPDDPVWRATADWIRSQDNPHHYSGPFQGRGSAHFRHPSVFGVVNDLLSDRSAEALALLASAPLDNGLACEGFDVQHGGVRTGGAFATLAGWLAYALARQVA